MADSPASSDLSDPPSAESDPEDNLSTAVSSSRPSVDITHADHDQIQPPPPKRRKPNPASTLHRFDRARSSQPADDNNDDILSISSDGFSSAPGSPSQNEYTLREEAQTHCLWRDCDFGEAANNDELVKHVQGTHCATGGPKKTKYVCEWGECQRKTSAHPSGYALKAHMRSHTKEKPYYCALPECDKAFTRSDALAKHMRTVHEPEPARTTDNPAPATAKQKSGLKLKLTNGHSTTNTSNTPTPSAKPHQPAEESLPPSQDEEGNPITPSPYNDNISYTPAHHPITGQPGFMITYPPDIHFTAWESSIQANHLMRLLRRQVGWAKKEGEDLKLECEQLERLRRQEWEKKEIILEGVLESELARAEKEGLLKAVDYRVEGAMMDDALRAKQLDWTGEPDFRREDRLERERILRDLPIARDEFINDVKMEDTIQTPVAQKRNSASPPPTGYSGGFDGDADPYDNYLAGRMAEYEERERLRSLHNTPVKQRNSEQQQHQREREVDAVGALMGMSGQADAPP